MEETINTSNMRSAEEKEQNFLFRGSTLIAKRREYTRVYAVVMLFDADHKFDSGTGCPASLSQSKMKTLKRSWT
jgi:peptide methionine sulfoxide reductase MsrB